MKYKTLTLARIIGASIGSCSASSCGHPRQLISLLHFCAQLPEVSCQHSRVQHDHMDQFVLCLPPSFSSHIYRPNCSIRNLWDSYDRQFSPLRHRCAWLLCPVRRITGESAKPSQKGKAGCKLSVSTGTQLQPLPSPFLLPHLWLAAINHLSTPSLHPFALRQHSKCSRGMLTSQLAPILPPLAPCTVY
jgi:hypothetical protein